jgi:hypothetical protein
MSCIRSCYDKGNTNFGHEDCTTCIHGDRPPKPKRELVCVCGAVWEGDELVESPRAETKREWVGLTDRDIEAIWGEDVSLMYSCHYDAIRAIEAKLKEKNT